MTAGKHVKYYVAASAALITLLVYLPSLQNEFVDWDDGEYVFDNPFIRSFDWALLRWAFSNFYAANWHPLTWVSHALDYAVWGLNPLGHHLTSVVLHAANTFVVVFLTISLIGAARRPGENDHSEFLHDPSMLIAAGVTGLLFGLHPVHVESVAWVSERKDLLCALFFLLSIIAYMKYAGSMGGETHRAERKGSTPNAMRFAFFTDKHYLATMAFFVLALLSKPMAVTLPAVLLVLDWHPFNRIRNPKTALAAFVEKLPLMALSLISSVLTILAQRADGALQSAAFAPLSTRVPMAIKSLMAYLGKMVAPLNLIPFYPYPRYGRLFSAEYLLPIALVTGITIASMIIARKHKLWLSAWGCYVVMLFPVLGIVQVGGQAMADRYTYLPSIAPFLIVGLGAAWISGKVRGFRYAGLFCGIAGILLFTALSFITVRQTAIWNNSLGLWDYVIEKTPETPLAYVNRGLVYENRERFDKAIEDFSKAITLDPLLDAAYNNRGMVFGKTGRFDMAIEDFNRAIALNPSDPTAVNNLGIIYGKAGSFDKAFEQFNKALLLRPDLADAYYNRAVLYFRSGNKGLAIADYRSACNLGHDNGCGELQQLTRGPYSE